MPDNVESMMYVVERPWHGKGTRLDKPATAEEAIVAAGLDWEVTLRPLFTDDGSKVPGKYATVRSDRKVIDDSRVLGIVGKDYVPLQNREAFAFFDAVVGEGKAIYHTAGSLDGGRRIWVLAKLPNDIVVRGDLTESYLLLSNGHDGLHPVAATFTPIRVVCQNTLTAAIEGSTNVVRIRHTKGMKARMEEAYRVLEISTQYYRRLSEAAEVLASKQVKKSELDKFLEALLPFPKDEHGNVEETTYVKNRRAEIERLFDGEGKGLDDPRIRHTAWALYNAAVEWADWIRPTKSKREDARYESILWGPLAETKAKAFDLAVQLATN